MIEKAITFLASFLIWFMFAGLFVLWVIDGRIKKEQVLHALFAATLAWVLAEMIKSVFPTLRPFRFNGFPILTITVPGDSAFPSAHMALATALATAVFSHSKKLGIWFALAALAVGIGRIMANVHTPLDILGGAILGIAASYLIRNIHLGRLLARKK